MKKVIAVFMLGFLFMFCSSKEQWEIMVEEKISQINEGIEVVEINLDEAEKIPLEPATIIRSDTTGEHIIGVHRSMIALNDSLYILDQTQSGIFAMDAGGNIARKIGGVGRGPGEFLQPVDIATNGQFIFVYDGGGLRMNVLDQHFEYMTSFNATPEAFSRSVSAGDSLLYVVDKSRISDPDTENLVQQYHLYPDLQKKRGIVPRLLPAGRQPAVMNNLEFYTNLRGYLLAAYKPLPRLFLYGPEGELTHSISILLSGAPVERVDELNQENNRRYRFSSPGTSIGRAPYIYSLLFDDDFNIYLFTVNRNLFILSIKDGKYELMGNYGLEHPDGAGIREQLSFMGNQLAVTWQNFPNDILIYNMEVFFNKKIKRKN